MSSKQELERAKEIIFEQYTTTTKAGKKSTVKAQHLWRFLVVCIAEGVEYWEKLSPKSTKRKLKQLDGLGFNRQCIERWHTIDKNESKAREQIVLVLKNYPI